MEHVYQINLPQINEFIKDEVFVDNDDHLIENTLFFNNQESYFKKNIIHGIEFISILYLKKNNSEGIIHKDGLNGKDEFHFGINFNLIGEMYLKYWTFDHVEYLTNQTTMNDYDIRYPCYRALTPPDFVYILEPNKTYLIDASIPHCGGCTSLKKTYSLRTNKKEQNRLNLLTWSSVVDYFSNIIIS
jgi:hypothetical protein